MWVRHYSLYAGGDLNLGNDMTLPDVISPNWCDESDTADLTVLRNNVKNILFTVVNSNAMNAPVDHYQPAWWKITTWAVDAAAVVLIVLTGILYFRKRKKA